MNYVNLAAWDIRVTIDLFLGGIGVGAFLVSVLTSFYVKKNLETRIKIGAYTAPIAVSIGLLVLVAKLGVSSKFITTLWNVNFQSIMSVGVFLQTFFVLFAFLYAFLVWKDSERNTNFRLVQTFGTFFAFATGLYHGLFLSSLGRVLWTELTPGMFFISSITSGIAFVLLIELFIPKAKKEENSVVSGEIFPLGLYKHSVMFFVAFLVQLVSYLLWQFYTGRLDLEQAISYEYFLANYGLIWTIVVLIGGTLIPMFLSLSSMIKKEEVFSKITAIITCVLVLVGGFTMKHLLIISGQIVIPIGFNF